MATKVTLRRSCDQCGTEHASGWVEGRRVADACPVCKASMTRPELLCADCALPGGQRTLREAFP